MILSASFALSACAGGSLDGSTPVGGVASYDALKTARDACAKRGGAIVQRAQTSGKRLADFECKGK